MNSDEKSKKYVLLIFVGLFSIRFVIVEIHKNDFQISASSLLRVPKENFDFSISAFILEYLSNWGQKIGRRIVESDVFITPSRSDSGIDDVVIFSEIGEADLEKLTPIVFSIKRDVTEEGARRLFKLLKFKNLIYVSFNFDSISLIKFVNKGQKSMRVIAETRKIEISKDLNYGFQEILTSWNDSFVDFTNFIANSLRSPTFNELPNEKNLYSFLFDFTILSEFKNIEKLSLNEFGTGREDENLLVLAGERLNISSDYYLFFLAVSTAFKLNGNYKVLIDNNDLFSFFISSEKLVLKRELFKHMLKELCLVLSFKGGKSYQLGKEIADVSIISKIKDFQSIPLEGYILRSVFDESVLLKMFLKHGYTINGEIERTYKDFTGEFVFDCRDVLLSDKKELWKFNK